MVEVRNKNAIRNAGDMYYCIVVAKNIICNNIHTTICLKLEHESSSLHSFM